MMLFGITRMQAFKYVLLPEITPRLRTLMFSGFQFIPYFLALVYQAVRLLPRNHPYTFESNIGHFGVRHVIAAAANNLVISMKNIDQIILFCTIMIGFVMIFLQLVVLGVSLVSQPVMAAIPDSFEGFFVTRQPSQDIAHILLDMVFGIPDMFNSCIATTEACKDSFGNDIIRPQGQDWIFPTHVFPFPIHVGLHQMFHIYSTGLLVVATFIAGYFLITVVAETAQTGTAFGKRFNKVWAPLRIVAAFGLLVPLGYGLNASQYIVLYAAKFGSAFATNGWILFNEALNENYLGGNQRLVSTPNIPEIGTFLQFMHVAQTCKWAEKIGSTEDDSRDIKPYLVTGPLEKINFLEITSSSNPTYEEMIKFANGATQVKVRFGVRDKKEYGRYEGFVKPFCGDLVFNLQQPFLSENGQKSGVEVLQRYYWFVWREIWFRSGPVVPTYPDFAKITACTILPKCASFDEELYKNLKGRRAESFKPSPEFAVAMQEFYSKDIRAALNDPGSTGLSGIVGSNKGAIEEQINSGAFNVSPTLKAKGWAGAGIWYNKIAELNGAVTSATLNVPSPALYPYAMEYVREKRKLEEPETSPSDIFNPEMKNGTIDKHAEKAGALYVAYKYWQENTGTSSHVKPTGNIFINTVNMLFGTEGLYSLRNNPDVHPLAGLVGIGRSLIESSIRNVGVAAFGGAVGAIFDGFIGQLGNNASSFFVTVAMMGLTIGFVLFYVVPFLPFIYFFFAVSTWVKGIFEAMLGAPLWALAHIRIDGEGLPGKAAESGYYFILEIFLRPILVVFGLLASIVIYSALVETLNETMNLVTANIGGFDVNAENQNVGPTDIEFYRGPVDEFFYTVLYAIIVYMMGTASFKLIDQIPNKILRWMGNASQTFSELSEDPTEQVMSLSQQGSQQAVGAVGGGLNSLLKGVGSLGNK